MSLYMTSVELDRFLKVADCKICSVFLLVDSACVVVVLRILRIEFCEKEEFLECVLRLIELEIELRYLPAEINFGNSIVEYRIFVDELVFHERQFALVVCNICFAEIIVRKIVTRVL